MDKKELIMGLRSKVFGDRGTDIQAAWNYAESIINNMDDSHNRGPAWTAIHVLANTIANAIEAMPDPLPAPAEEIKIETVQLSLDRATLDDIIDARVSHWFNENIDIENSIQDWINDNLDWGDIVRDELINNISLSVTVD